ncbi:hypothetical protein [Flavobacterium sufflavum]|nr:hypothetical protein [Flavobacterium sufflavum]
MKNITHEAYIKANIFDQFPNSTDNRNILNGFKDLNDWFMKNK